MQRLNGPQRGFTLIEVAVVLLIVGVLLGYSVALFPVQQELKQYNQAETEMEKIMDALVAYAQVNGRLPCPDTVGDINATGANAVDGIADFDDLIDNDTGAAGADGRVDNCKAFFGLVPARTLGLNGKYVNGVLLDPWGTGYGYAISEADIGGDGNVDLVSPDGIRDEGIAVVQPDLFICDDNTAASGADDTDCTDVTGGEVLGTNGDVAAVIISLGKDNDVPAASNVQAENLDDFDNGTNDKVYIFAPRADDYDDIVMWIPTSRLISKMIEANQLP